MPTSLNTSRSCRSIGRLMTSPMAPCSLCSHTSVTVRTKFGPAMAGMAIRKWLWSEAPFMAVSARAAEGLVEDAGAGDVQDVGLGPHVGGERHERRGHLDDAHGRVVQQLVAGGAA